MVSRPPILTSADIKCTVFRGNPPSFNSAVLFPVLDSVPPVHLVCPSAVQSYKPIRSEASVNIALIFVLKYTNYMDIKVLVG